MQISTTKYLNHLSWLWIMLAKLFKSTKPELEHQLYIPNLEINGKKFSFCITPAKKINLDDIVKSIENTLEGKSSIYEFIKDIEIPNDVGEYIKSLIYVKIFEECESCDTNLINYWKLFKLD